MDSQEWYRLGAQIGDLVQSAIDSNDFKQLNQSITETINDTVNLVQKNIQNGKNTAAHQGENASYNRRNAYYNRRNAYQQAMERAAGKMEQAGRRMEAAAGTRRVQKEGTGDGKNLPVRAASDYKGITLMAVGYSFMGIFGILGMVFLALSGAWGGFGVPAVLFLILTGGFTGMGVKGSQIHGRVKRLRRYLQILGGRDHCMLEELAAGTGKPKKFVQKDLSYMIQNHLFQGEAYLDEGGTCLMTSREAYQQYQAAMKQFELRRKEEKALEESRKSGAEKDSKGQDGREETKGKTQEGQRGRAEDTPVLSREEQEILRDGRDFISHIHACNDDIEGQVMSDKLERLENVVTRIFDQVARKPESAPDLHKMMSYYLPITRKLVDAYRDLDAQPVEGQNISRTKKEIEDSLDTINTAFENLLDSFFQDTAWDISSDISVLHTMMAQDGLTKKDFAAGERTRTVAADVAKKKSIQ